MRFSLLLLGVGLFVAFSFAQIYISEVSDASAYQNEFLELYNNSASDIDLTGYKLVRVDASTNTSEYVFDIGTDESGASDVIIPAYGFLVIARGNDRATFESEWTNMPSSAKFNTGNTNLYFGAGTARRWRLRANDGTANTDDGTLMDDTGQAVAGDGNRHYQQKIGGPWVLDNFSNGTPGYFDSDQTLPVALSLFQAHVKNEHVILQWRTESEVENVGFEVYRSVTENSGFVLLDSYRSNPQLKGQLNSSTARNYRFEDFSVTPGQTYYYKIADVDVKGQRTFHGPLKVLVTRENVESTIGAVVIKTFKLYPNFPNPFNPATHIKFDVPAVKQGVVSVQVNVYNLNGQKVRTLLDGDLQGNAQYQLTWDGTDETGNSMPAGIYFVQLRSSRFVQTLKVCLVK